MAFVVQGGIGWARPCLQEERMRWMGGLLAIGLVVLIGACGGDPVEPPPQTDRWFPDYHLEDRTIRVEDVRADAGTNDVCLEVAFIEPGDTVHRTVRLRQLPGPRKTSWGGFDIAMPGNTYRLSARWDTDDPNRMRFLQAARGDTLEVVREFTAGVLTEIYRFNGDADTFSVRGDFDLVSEEAPVWSITPENYENSALARAFRRVYPGSTALEDNVEGLRLADLIFRTDIAERLADRLRARTPPGVSAAANDGNSMIRVFCRNGRPCVILLCWFRSWKSPLCEGCGLFSMACEWAWLTYCMDDLYDMIQDEMTGGDLP
jgi:hypothetical protein